MLTKEEIGILLLRLFLGVTFFIHGLVKFQDGIGQTVGFFDSIGIPGFLAYVVAIVELVGGLAVLLGVGTKYVSILFAIIMVGAIATVKWPAGFLGGYELDVALLAISVYFALAKTAPLALDNILFTSKK
ncbi:DoxX family protein [Halalkalibacterium halodurans]|uniref:BH3304 protein n=2 Tax=Halalkalibacterium halodurans TaxID=86665 RepID=Q7AJS4_HALH5|nr:DoxX family protein [Halalkalibacterium halodurans]MDY7223838.1 DoxX family protein [Halalkalibacterium halodurans]MDY7243059.1 DoxX family protein [Halalkalibacterium halodurans]MED3648040.1 DoxX family protein [Halalkalibacterium halodurans]MED4083124.1 DoxX family protein [Halalkalibacterium halodurans]MED4086974.1 DoxX family protein [Halalkalibacterium halodurans]